MNGTVRIHNADRAMTESVLRRLFTQYGEIKKITLPRRGQSTDALVEYTNRTEAKEAIKAMNGTTVNTIAGSFKKIKRINTEFVWALSLVTPDELWEEDKEDTKVQIERDIVKEKKKNMRYVERIERNRRRSENKTDSSTNGNTDSNTDSKENKHRHVQLFPSTRQRKPVQEYKIDKRE